MIMELDPLLFLNKRLFTSYNIREANGKNKMKWKLIQNTHKLSNTHVNYMIS